MRFARTCAVAVTAAAAGAAATAATALAQPARGLVGQQAGHSNGFHLPYTDPNQVGLLTLCGVNLKPVTHGLITTKPFVWRAVSSVPAPKGYFVKGAKAQMFAYQPRPYTPAGAWSGTVMAAASFYSSRMHPMAQFTPIDEPLSYMTIAYPPIWHHLIELRLYLGAPNVPEDTTGYAAADLQVNGNTWTLVEGGHASCTSGQAVSVETVVHMPGASGTPKPQPSGSAAPTSSASPDASPSAGPSRSPLGAAPVADSHASGNGAAVLAIGIVALVLVAMASGALWWRRKRRVTG